MSQETFKSLYQRAADRKGGAQALEILLGLRILGKKLLADSAADQSVAKLSVSCLVEHHRVKGESECLRPGPWGAKATEPEFPDGVGNTQK